MLRALLVGLLLAASWIGIGGRDSDEDARLRWTERIAAVQDGTAHAYVALDMGDFGAGEHSITLTATVDGRSASGTTSLHVGR